MTMSDCTCQLCVDACKHRPGWFAYGEAEQVAERLGKPLADLVGRELTIDYWVDDPEVHLLMPSVQGNSKKIQGFWPDEGVCVFLVDDRCAIHDIKPYECRVAFACRGGSVHKATADTWRTPEAKAQMDGLR